MDSIQVLPSNKHLENKSVKLQTNIEQSGQWESNKETNPNQNDYITLEIPNPGVTSFCKQSLLITFHLSHFFEETKEEQQKEDSTIKVTTLKFTLTFLRTQTLVHHKSIQKMMKWL